MGPSRHGGFGCSRTVTTLGGVYGRGRGSAGPPWGEIRALEEERQSEETATKGVRSVSGGEAGRRPVPHPLAVRVRRGVLPPSLLMGGKLICRGRVNVVAPGRLLHLQDDVSKRCYLIDTGTAYSIYPYTVALQSASPVPICVGPLVAPSGAGERGSLSCLSAASPSPGLFCWISPSWGWTSSVTTVWRWMRQQASWSARIPWPVSQLLLLYQMERWPPCCRTHWPPTGLSSASGES